MQWAVLSYAFVVGMAATVNPCGAAMLPAYLTCSGRSSAGLQAPAARRLSRAVADGLVATVGFVAVFAVLGALVRAGLAGVMGATPYVGIAAGAALAAVGGLSAAGHQPRLRLVPTGRALGAGRGRLPGMLGFGVSYALASLGCALPVFLAGVAGAFTRGGIGTGLGSFVAYGLGMGSVLTALAVVVALAPSSRLRRARAFGARLERPAGVLLFVVGAYIVYYWAADILGPGAARGPVAAVDSAAAGLAGLLQGAGPLLGASLAGAVAAAVALAKLAEVRRSPRPRRSRSETGDPTEALHPRLSALGAEGRQARPRRARKAIPFIAAGLAAATVEAVVAGGLLGWGSTSPSAEGSVLLRSSASREPALSQAIKQTLSFQWLPGSPQQPPPFTLVDQRARPVSLSSFRGKAVILTFNDNHSRELGPLYAEDVRTAVADLGPLATRVAFVAVNVNPFFPSVAADLAFDRAHGLSSVAEWHYLTGPLPTLEAVWRAYGEQPTTGPDDSVSHDPTIEFIGPSGNLRAVGDYGPGSADATRWGYALARAAEALLGSHVRLAAHTLAPLPPSSAARAPSFRLPALGSPGRVSLRGLRGRLVVLNFFASWCSACRSEAAGLARAAESLPQGARLVGIDVSDSRSQARSFLHRYRLSYPVGFDADGTVAAAYGVSDLPTTIFISPSGRLLARHIGDISQSALARDVHRLLASSTAVSAS